MSKETWIILWYDIILMQNSLLKGYDARLFVAEQIKKNQIGLLTRIHRSVVSKYVKRCQEILLSNIEEEVQVIGGEGIKVQVKVQVDESKFGCANITEVTELIEHG